MSMHVPTRGDNLATTYDEKFFAAHDKRFYPVMAREFLDVLADDDVDSVVDFGCGHGFLVEAFRHHGLTAHGIEGSSAAEKMWPEDNRSFYQIADLSKQQDNALVPSTQLVTSFEVAEHLSHEDAGQFLTTMTIQQPRYVVFGAATVFQDLGNNATHVNEKPFQYWIDLFAKQGYVHDVLRTVNLKEKLFTLKPQHGIKWWYPKNVMVFLRKDLFAHSEQRDDALMAIDTPALQWRIRTNKEVFNAIMEKDRYEYQYLVEAARLQAAQRKLAK